MDKNDSLKRYIADHPDKAGKVVDFDAANERLLKFDFTASNSELTPGLITDTTQFSKWVANKLKQTNCKFGFGGYFEHRTIYARSSLFSDVTEPRRLHLGVDIWGAARTSVFAPFGGRVHSFKDNNQFGDYGPTIILEHNLNGLALFTLYGHLNRGALKNLSTGKWFNKNEMIAKFGDSNQNGGWPPHLHFQLMFDMEGHEGDYPGVCRFTERHKYRQNVPDPNLVLQFKQETAG